MVLITNYNELVTGPVAGVNLIQQTYLSRNCRLNQESSLHLGRQGLAQGRKVERITPAMKQLQRGDPVNEIAKLDHNCQ